MARPYDFTSNVIDQARLRQNGKCALCGSTLDDLAEDAHHVIPNQSGDPGNPAHDWLRSVDNCVVLCSLCHDRGHEDAKFRAGSVAPPDYYPYSHGILGAPEHQAWVASLNQRANELFAAKLKVLEKLKDLQSRVKGQIDLYSSEHTVQLKLYNGSFVGFVTNQLFNGEPPSILIWANPYSYCLHAGSELAAGNLKEGFASILRARFGYLGALKVYTTWKDGIEGAGTKMEVAIGAVSVAAVLAFVAPAAVAALAEEEVGTAATLAKVRVLCEGADAAIRVADASEAANELLEIERMQAIEQALVEAEKLYF